MTAAIRDDNPVIYLEHKRLYRSFREDIPVDDYIVPLGEADIKREGSDLSIITYGAMVHSALAAERLAADGFDCEIVDLRSIVPFDLPAVMQSVEKTGRVLVATEEHRTGGFGGGDRGVDR